MQRSRVNWLCEGDANTQFFHHSTLQRRQRNKVFTIKDEEGNWVENPYRVCKLVEDHFMHTFTSEGSRNWGTLLDCVIPSVSADMNEALLKPVSKVEIKEEALKMRGLKALGPDGFQWIFYQSFWEHVHEDVIDLVGVLMQGSPRPCFINATHIVLIPKVPNPESVSQFRPISLCNYSYKVLSKVLANRLWVILPKIISHSQNAFVAGRQIQDIIGIAHEMFHFLKWMTDKRKFDLGIKLNMMKAYDRDFLDAIMERMGFFRLWMKLIMGCVSSVKFDVILNGQPGDKFVPSRGFRQGDPLSPYLFILVGEVLSRMIQEAVDAKNLDGKVNLQKSSVFFGANVPNKVAAELGSILGMSVVDNPGTYLGVPAIWGRLKKRGLAYVKGRILGKFQGWKQSTLSRAGREVLIKAVVQAIPAYSMSIFKFHVAVCQELDAMVARFWCDFVFNQVPVNPSKVLFAIVNAVGSFLLVVKDSGTISFKGGAREAQVSRWCPHSSPFIKINMDASWSKVSRLGFAGVVARSEGGRFVATVRYPLMAPSSTVAEALALLHGCELGASLGVSSVIFKSDSWESISCLSGSLNNGNWEAFPILGRVQRLSGAFQFRRWSWVSRSANVTADILASAGFTEMCDIVWVDMPPSSLIHVLCNDGLPCPH
ncbi:unnamed protein product [Malus baccata var. baccata]